MTPTDSTYLDDRAKRGLRKAGGVVAPGSGDLPGFSEADLENADRLLGRMSDGDREDFLLLMRVFAFLPRPVIKRLLEASEYHRKLPHELEPIAKHMRMLNVGVKGVIANLHYTEDVLGWPTSVDTEPADLDDEQRRSVEARQLALRGYDTAMDVGDEDAGGTAPGTEAPSGVTDGGTNTAPDGGTAEADLSTATSGEAVLSRPVTRTVPQDEVDDLYERAEAGQESLQELSVAQRVERIGELRRAIVEEREWILDEIQHATNKERTGALVTLLTVLDHLRYLESEAESILADEAVDTPLTMMGKDSRIQFGPLGTVLIISPWNYPFYQAIVPITSAFVTGNTVVYKPSEYTPMEGLLEELFERARFHDDWVQIVYGDGETGSRLVEYGPDKIFFTGSESTGKQIMQQAAETLTPVELELGGKDPAIVFDDVAVERTATGVVWGGFTHSGQSCTSIERCYVQSGVYEEFKRELVDQVRRLRQDVSADPNYDLGCMTTGFQVEQVADHVEDATEKGATLLTGQDWDRESPEIPPMIIEGVTNDMAIARDETFGPVLPLYSFETEAEALERANDSRYGLSASVWSTDLERADRVARKLEVGNVSINNVMVTEGNPALPFGGTKASGFGRYKGHYGLRSFCNVKSVMSEDNDSGFEPNWHPYDETKHELLDRLLEHRFARGLAGLPRFALTGLRLERYSDKLHEDDQD